MDLPAWRKPAARYLSGGDAFVCAQLFSLQPIAIVQNVALPPVWRAVRAPFSTPTDGFHV
jgi:hypothetical protein